MYQQTPCSDPFMHLFAILASFENGLLSSIFLVTGQPGQRGMVLENHRTIRPGSFTSRPYPGSPALRCLTEPGNIQHGRLAAAQMAITETNSPLAIFRLTLSSARKTPPRVGKSIDTRSAQEEAALLRSLNGMLRIHPE
jgi:hypothetical protein